VTDVDPLCPSALGQPGATLIGISSGRGALGYVTPPVVVDEDFLAAAGEHPEQGFRFANRCAGDRCHNWGEDRCQLIHPILASRPGDPPVSFRPAASVLMPVVRPGRPRGLPGLPGRPQSRRLGSQ
jgi:hypothetical protein